MSAGYRIVEGDASALALVEPLFETMVDHHRDVAGHQWPVRDRVAAWNRRRREYVGWLESGKAWLLMALPSGTEPPSEAVGYAFLRVHEPGSSWELGEEIGELESLSVAEAARGHGVGTMLINRARTVLRERGVRYWSVEVVEANVDAVRLYEREGFRPYYRQLLGKIG